MIILIKLPLSNEKQLKSKSAETLDMMCLFQAFSFKPVSVFSLHTSLSVLLGWHWIV